MARSASREPCSATNAISQLPSLDDLIGGARGHAHLEHPSTAALLQQQMQPQQPEDTQAQLFFPTHAHDESKGAPTEPAPSFSAFNFGSPPATPKSESLAWDAAEDDGAEEDNEAPFGFDLDLQCADGYQSRSMLDDDDDLLANMTPISGLQNLSESIVVNGIRYHATAMEDTRRQARAHSSDKTRHSGHQRQTTPTKQPLRPPQVRSVSASPRPSHRKELMCDTGSHRRCKSTAVPSSPGRRSQPIPIPKSPVMKGMKRVRSTGNFKLPDGSRRDLAMFRLDGGIPVHSTTEHEDFHDFGNSYRDHGQGFAFHMQL